MNNATRRFFMLVALTAPLLLSCATLEKEKIRIDGSSDDSVRRSYQRMANSLNLERQMKLSGAIVQLNLIGVESATDMLADPGLRNPGPVRIKDKIAGLSFNEIIALANQTATVKTYTKGQEPGVPADLLTPLAAGQSTYLLESTQWRFVTSINGYLKEAILDFNRDGKLETNDPLMLGTSTWEQSADEVRVFINDRYAVSRGKFVDADHIQGTGGNHVGSTWTWTAERQ